MFTYPVTFFGQEQFVVQAGDFDGTTDNGRRTAAWSGVSDGREFSFSVWFTVDGGNASLRHIWGDNTSSGILLDTNNFLRFLGTTAAPASVCDLQSSAIAVNSGVWRHACGSFSNVSTPVHSLLIDGVSDKTVNFAGTQVMAFGTAGHRVGNAEFAPTRFWNGGMAEFLLWYEYIDWTDPDNLAKVYNNGKPVDPGADGSLVTGTAPAVYCGLREDDVASAFYENDGTGGPLVDQASLTIYPTSPSD